METFGQFAATRPLRPRTPGSPSDPGVESWAGVDLVTGMPVVVYTFRGAPPEIPEAASPLLPAVLESGTADGRGYVVVAFAPGFAPLRPTLPPARLAWLARSSARALERAHAAGLRHGDLRPDRLFSQGDQLLVEGFGLAWPDEPESPYRAPEGPGQPPADVYAWACCLRALGRGGPERPLDGELGRLTGRCLLADPAGRPVAAELLDLVEVAVLADAQPLIAPPAGALDPPEVPAAAAPAPRPGRAERRAARQRPAGRPIVPPASAIVPPAPATVPPAPATVPPAPATVPPAPASAETAGVPAGQLAPPERLLETPEVPSAGPAADARPTPDAVPAAGPLPATVDHHTADPSSTPSQPVLDHSGGAVLVVRAAPRPGAGAPEAPEPGPASAAPDEPDVYGRRESEGPIRIGWQEDDSWRAVRAPEAPPRRAPLPVPALLAAAAAAVSGAVLLFVLLQPAPPAAAPPAAGSADPAVLSPVPSAPAGAVVVNFTIDPPGARDGRLSALEVPAGSGLEPGDVIATVPGPVLFPVAGRYRLRVSLEGYESRAFELDVRATTDITLRLADLQP